MRIFNLCTLLVFTGLLLSPTASLKAAGTHSDGTTTKRREVDLLDFERSDTPMNTEYLNACTKKEPLWDPKTDPAYGEKAEKPEVSEAAAKARGILEKRCATCHQPNSSGGSSKFPDILDAENLINKKLIIPGKPEESSFYTAISGDAPSMPADGTHLSEEDRSIVKDWISAGAPSLKKNSDEKDYGFISEADKELCILEDLKTMSKIDQSSMRYFTLTHLYNAGKKARLKETRDAISMLINSFSSVPNIARPEPIDPTGTIFRIDLRKYGLSPEAWDLISAANPYGNVANEGAYRQAVKLAKTKGYNSADLKSATPPFVRGDWFVFRGSQPPLYYDLLGIPGGDRKPGADKALEAGLGVDVARNLQLHNVARAGIRISGVADFNRIDDRHDSHFGAYHKSGDFLSSNGERNIHENPLNLKPDASEIIFTLPNGLQGYMLVDKDGVRLDKGDLNLVKDKNRRRGDGAVINGISCMNCHNRGMNPMTDQVRGHVQAFKDVFGRKDTEEVEALYKTREEFEKLLKGDQDRFETALDQTRYKSDTAKKSEVVQRPIPAFKVFEDFQENLSFEQVAAELGLTPADLQKGLDYNPKLKAILALDATGGTDRAVFNEEFGRILTELQLGQFIPPTAKDQEIFRLQGQLERAINTVSGLKKEIAHLELNAQANQAEIAKLKGLLVTAEAQKADALHKIGALEAEIKRLTAPPPPRPWQGRSFDRP